MWGVWISAVVALLGVVSCNDSRSTGSTPTTVKPAADIVAAAVDQVGPRTATLGTAEQNRNLLSLVMGSKGVSAADASCYLDIVVPSLGPAFATLTVSDIFSWLSVTDARLDPAVRSRAEACFTQPSLDRRKAKQIDPGLDVAGLRTIAVIVTAKNGVAVGLTPTEAECYGQTSYGTLTDDDVRAGFAPGNTKAIRQPAAAISACVTMARLDRLAPGLQTKLIDQLQRDQAEHDRVQSSIDAEIRKQLASSTTVP